MNGNCSSDPICAYIIHSEGVTWWGKLGNQPRVAGRGGYWFLVHNVFINQIEIKIDGISIWEGDITCNHFYYVRKGVCELFSNKTI